MPLTNAQKQAAFRQRRAQRFAALTEGYQSIITEVGEPKGEKGKRILEIAQEALKL